MKKLLALVLSLLMVVSAVPFTAFAEDENPVVQNIPEEKVSEQENKNIEPEEELPAQAEEHPEQEELPTQTAALSEQGETSGECGDNLTWSYDTETATLTISGTGKMYDYYTSPWHNSYSSFSGKIKTVIISNSVTNNTTDIGN